MKRRILTGWTFRRGLYLVLGIFVLVQSALDKQWWGIIFGGYFAMMGLFAFGCAGGNCSVTPKPKSNKDLEDVEFEEIK